MNENHYFINELNVLTLFFILLFTSAFTLNDNSSQTLSDEIISSNIGSYFLTEKKIGFFIYSNLE